MRRYRRLFIAIISAIGAFALVLFAARGVLLRKVISAGNVSGVKFAFFLGADCNAWDPNSESSPLQNAASQGNLEVVRLLLDRGADVNAKNQCSHTALHWAAQKGHVAVVQLLLEKGARVDIVDDDFRTTPLGWAFNSKATPEARFTIVRLLLEHGANPNTDMGALGGYPLDWADEINENELAAYLRAHGAKHAPGPLIF